MPNKNWFDIDKKGLAQILARKGKEFAIFELMQNAWDEPGVTCTNTVLVNDPAPGYALLRVTDDAPNGFENLRDAYTLFAPSKKKGNPELRGRFNLGEKLVLALAKEAHIVTTSGTISFGENGRRQSSAKSVTGSAVQVVFRMTDAEIKAAVAACDRLIPPLGMKVIVNNVQLQRPPAFDGFQATLTTEVSDPEGHLVKAQRRTNVEVYLADEKHPAAIYEMGIPVCEIEGRYCFNVMQKVPLTMDREEVLPAFRKQLAVAALNEMHAHMDSEDANTGWATEAVTSPDAKPEAVKSYVTQRFGEKVVAFDPSDPEANHTAAAQGYVVVNSRQLSKGAWANVRAAGAVPPAGQVCPTPNPFSEHGAQVPLAKRTPGIDGVEAYAKLFARVVCGIGISVEFRVSLRGDYAAAYGGRRLLFNVGRLGYKWFDPIGNRLELDDLLIHELGHEYCGDHLDKKFNDALTRIGAKLAQAIREGKI